MITIRNLFKKVLTIFAAFLFVCLFEHDAIAHRIDIMAKYESGTVYSETIYPDGKPVMRGRVEVFDKKGVKLFTGKTDDNGKYSFSLGRQTEVILTVSDGMGHKNKILIQKEVLK